MNDCLHYEKEAQLHKQAPLIFAFVLLYLIPINICVSDFFIYIFWNNGECLQFLRQFDIILSSVLPKSYIVQHSTIAALKCLNL